MTGQQAIDSFLVYYDRITSFSAPGYTTEEILLFLNNAQDEFIKERVFGKNFQPPALEDNQKRVADISPLIETTAALSVNTYTNYGSKAWRASKEDTSWDGIRYLWSIDADADLTRSGYPVISSEERIRCQKIKNEDAGRFIVSTVNKPHFINPKFLEDSHAIVFLADSYTTHIDQVFLTYVKKPYPIIQASQEFDGTYAATHMSLDSSVHQEIVDIAVRQALQVQQDPRWQTQVQEQQIKDN